MKKVLITGCSGFVGHHLIPVCQERGWYVIGVDKRPIPKEHSRPDMFILTDVADLGFRDLIDVDYVFHLAWRTNIPDCQRHPIESTRENIDMSIHLMEYCKEAKVKKFLFPSTASLYGYNPTPWTEDMPCDPIEPYSWQKMAIEYACLMYSKSYGLPTVRFRFFQIFGEFSREDNAIAVFLKRKKEGIPINLVETTGKGKSGERDFIYAGDIARAMVVVAESEYCNGELFNVAGGKYNTIKEIAETIGNEYTWAPRREYEVTRHHADISKIVALGWKPTVNVIKWLKTQVSV
jgi:nucleoside-diphosphate-sugar epimerase